MPWIWINVLHRNTTVHHIESQQASIESEKLTINETRNKFSDTVYLIYAVTP